MEKIMIVASINLSKIDKARINEKDGQKYYDIILIPTPDGKYGDYMVVEQVTKEERQAGKKGTILGNGKNIGR